MRAFVLVSGSRLLAYSGLAIPGVTEQKPPIQAVFDF